MKSEQACLQDCVNTRMILHLGEENANKYGMLVDFEKMKREYQGYEDFVPHNKTIKKYVSGAEEADIKNIVGML